MTKLSLPDSFWAHVPRPISCAAVIGAGAMGGGIAAQFANAGIKVILLDMPGAEGQEADAPARAGLARQVKIRGFMGPSGPQRVVTGNVTDNLDLLAEADWIVEAVVERLDVKRALYQRIDAVRKAGSIVSSNTSTLLHAELVEGLSPAFQSDFVISHFFNPPRVMPLLEIVTTPQTAPAIATRVHAAARDLLGKTAIDCRDTHGFVANRIGCFWMASAALIARAQGLSVEEADAVHQALGMPKTGVFGLLDLIGIDLVPTVWGSLVSSLPAEDRFQSYDIAADSLFKTLVDEKRFGRKSGAGFFRKGEAGMEATDLTTAQYRPLQPITPRDLPGGGKDLGALLKDPDRYGRYARAVLSEVIAYAATHGPDIAADPSDIDVAMRLGYAWAKGPFTLADQWGVQNVANTLTANGLRIPPLLIEAISQGAFYHKGQFLPKEASVATEATGLTTAALRAAGAVILGNGAATLFDTGAGIGLLDIHTKMNSIHPEVLEVIEQTLPLLGERLRGLVIGNDDARAFSAGADLRVILEKIDAGQEEALKAFIARGQKAYLGLRYAPVPVVAAVHGFALGGGCELALHADHIMAHAEAQIGLPEFQVGLLPAWGGCTSLFARNLAQGQSPLEAARGAARTIFAAKPTSSAEEALLGHILTDRDRLTMSRSTLLSSARDWALQLAEAGYTPPAPLVLTPVEALDLSDLAEVGTDYDRTLLAALAKVYQGQAPRSDAQSMQIEFEVLFDLIAQPQTRERMAHMLATGKPLKN